MAAFKAKNLNIIMKTLKEHIKNRIDNCNQEAWATHYESDAQVWVSKRKIYTSWLESLDDTDAPPINLSWKEFNELAEIHLRCADGNVSMADDYRYNEILNN